MSRVSWGVRGGKERPLCRAEEFQKAPDSPRLAHLTPPQPAGQSGEVWGTERIENGREEEVLAKQEENKGRILGLTTMKKASMAFPMRLYCLPGGASTGDQGSGYTPEKCVAKSIPREEMCFALHCDEQRGIVGRPVRRTRMNEKDSVRPGGVSDEPAIRGYLSPIRQTWVHGNWSCWGGGSGREGGGGGCHHRSRRRGGRRRRICWFPHLLPSGIHEIWMSARQMRGAERSGEEKRVRQTDTEGEMGSGMEREWFFGARI